MTDDELITRVRSFTTDSAAALPDEKILYFAGRGTDTSYTDNIFDSVLDLNGVLADAWAYLARADRYNSETQGALAVSGPLAWRMAAYYGSVSLKGVPTGAEIAVGTVRRTDIVRPVTDPAWMSAEAGSGGAGGEFGGFGL